MDPIHRFDVCKKTNPIEYEQYRRAQKAYADALFEFELLKGREVKIKREDRQKLREVNTQLSNTRKVWMGKLRETK